MNREIWKKVAKYDGYIEVSNLGNVRSIIYKNGEKIIRNLTKDLGTREEGMSDKGKVIEDLEKAIWYIKDKMEMIKKGQ